MLIFSDIFVIIVSEFTLRLWGGYFSMNKKIMSLSFMLSFLFGTCASQSYALPESGTKGQAMTDYVQISRQDFNQLQSQIAQLQNALNNLAKGRGRSNQKRGFLVSAVYFSALIILLTLLGSMAYVFYDYNCNFKGIKENEELGLMNYLLSKFRFVTGEKTQKITDMDKWLRELNSWTKEMQIWIKGIKDLNIEGMYKDLLPLLTALKEGKILDYMLVNFKFSYEEVVVKGNIINNDNNDKNKDDSTDEDEKIEKEENNKNKRKKTITLRELLKNPQFLFEGELRRFIKAFGKGNLLNYILDSWKISDKPLRVMLKPVLDLMGENSLEGFLNFKIKVGKEEEKTIKEIFVEPILEYMTAYLGKDEKGERLKSFEIWKGKSNKFNDKVIGYSKIFQNLDDKYTKEKKSVPMEELLDDLRQLQKIKEFYEGLIGKSEKEILNESENLLFDGTEFIKTILGDENLSKKLGKANGLLSAGNGVDALKNLGGLETKAQLRPQNQFSLYKMVVKLYKKLQSTRDKAMNQNRKDSDDSLKSHLILDNALNS